MASSSSSPLIIDLSEEPSVIDLEAVDTVGMQPQQREVIDLEGLAELIDLEADDQSLAASLEASLPQRIDVDLTTLRADSERRRQMRKDCANAIDLEAEPDDLLFEQRKQIEDLILRSAPSHVPRMHRGVAGNRQPRIVQLEVWLNPRSYPGSELYERFVAAWGKVPNKTIRLVFHGTPESNISDICRNGLDPRRRNGQAYGVGEYFGGNMDVSMAYCRGGRYMLVFAVLLDKSGVTNVVGAHEGVMGDIVVINRPEHQLPLAVVSIGCQRWQPHPSWLSGPDNLYSSADIAPCAPRDSASLSAYAFSSLNQNVNGLVKALSAAISRNQPSTAVHLASVNGMAPRSLRKNRKAPLKTTVRSRAKGGRQ
mmetsp:Transcript_8119/g.25365  ORF Transcript_8119/g.25365 Transcript_8119/m.25365 type:complete len:368 (-) Transcript_8119:393-1496(-)